MKDEFFEKILNAVENRPFITAVTSDGKTSKPSPKYRKAKTAA